MMAVLGITKISVMSGPRHRNYREVEHISTMVLLSEHVQFVMRPRIETPTLS